MNVTFLIFQTPETKPLILLYMFLMPIVPSMKAESMEKQTMKASLYLINEALSTEETTKITYPERLLIITERTRSLI